MLKKILIGIGVLFATVVLAGVVGWVGWLSPPSPEEVCTNVDKVVDAGAEDFMREEVAAKSKGKLPKNLLDAAVTQAVTKFKKDSEARCERFATKKPMMMARAVWVKRLKCWRDAPDMNSLQACDEIKSVR